MNLKSSKKHGELRIHIGAHKTATTHLQDTLNEIQNELLEYNINYISRDVGRPRLSKVIHWGAESLRYKILFGFQKRKIIKSVLFPDVPLDEKIVVSEENILGSTVDELSVNPYNNLAGRLNFIRQLSNEFHIKLFLSIRSFDRVLPAAYVTALRFRPEEALMAKPDLLSDLEDGQLPSWLDVVNRLKLVLPGTEIRIWTQEDYRHHSNKIITEFLGESINDVPVIPAPLKTVTPTYDSVTKVEDMIRNFDERPENWRAVCDSVYQRTPAPSDSAKYTFLNQDLISELRNKYQEDLEKISRLESIEMV